MSVIENDIAPSATALAPALEDLPALGRILCHARNPFDPLTRAFAAALARFHCRQHTLSPLWGMAIDEFQRAVDRLLPGLDASFLIDADAPETEAARLVDPDEFIELLMLLDEHRVDRGERGAWLIRVIALCCMAENHLWEDMGLVHRGELSDLIAEALPTLAARNTGNMRWKKFFYKQLCEREDIQVCRAPVCRECDDYDACFGPETPDHDAWRRRRD